MEKKRFPFRPAMAETPQHSKDLTVAEAANVIASLPDYDAVLAFVGNDDRKGVVEAAGSRGTALTLPDASSGGPTHPPEALRLGLPDGRASQPGKPFEKGQGNATVRTRWPIDSFDSGLKGVPLITAHGVEVDRAKAQELNELAGLNGIELEEIE